MRLSYRVAPEWPELAWVAEWAAGDQVATITHGAGVETLRDWFGEVVWDGDFDAAGFDATDVVFGSAGKSDGAGLTFVSSSATVDRLHWFEGADGTRLVSNSLVALLVSMGASLDPLRTSWADDFKSVIRGIDRYVDRLPTSRGDARLLYHRNLRYESERFHVIDKPLPRFEFAGFVGYRDYLERSICKIADNARSPSRSRRRFKPLGTVSTGFDSPTVCALARRAGLAEAITVTSSRSGLSDDGTEIGERLGLRVLPVPRDAWRTMPLCETKFLASDAKGEDVYFAGAGETLRGRLLLTGFAAAGTWSAKPRHEDDLRRTDQSGLSLTEFRLHAGFLHVPVPGIGARGRCEIIKALSSPEMAPWTSGLAYDKPFCRRTLSEAGVPPHLYGVEKKAASVLLFDRACFLTGEGLRDFRSHVRRATQGSYADRLRRALHETNARGRALGAAATIAVAKGLRKVTRWDLARRVSSSVRMTEAASRDPRFDYLFPWAVERVRSAYPAPGTATLARDADQCEAVA